MQLSMGQKIINLLIMKRLLFKQHMKFLDLKKNIKKKCEYNKISWGRTKSVKQLLERTNKSLDEILNEILVRYNKVLN